ncbi:MAG: hypothetical protein AAB795_01015 [Patescibacteria group bacterium]
MKVFVFGNWELDFDSTPLKILPELKKMFPKIDFEIKDPNEDWDIPDGLIIIDTVLGIDKITIFDSIKDFSQAPNITMHDFDVYANLKFLDKLDKLKKIKIIGVPSTTSEKEAIEKIFPILGFS